MRVRVNIEDSKGEGMRMTACVYVASCVGRGLGEGTTLSCAVIVVVVVTRWRREGW